MPWSGTPPNETFGRTDGTRSGDTTWQQAKSASVKINAADHDTHDEDIADGLNLALKKDGGNKATGDISLDTYKFTEVGNGTARDHYSAIGQVQDGSFLWGGTAGGSANALTISVTPGITAYAAGQTFRFLAASDNTAGATVDVNSVGVKSIVLPDGSALHDGAIQGGSVHEIAYDGTDFTLMNPFVGVTPRRIQQIANTVTGGVLSGTTTIPVDDTKPQNTEGDEVMTLAITPSNSASSLLIDILVNVSNSQTSAPITAALFQDSTADALQAGHQQADPGTGLVQIAFQHSMTAGTTSSTTFKVRVGSNGGTTTFNGVSGARRFGGALSSYIRITEILP